MTAKICLVICLITEVLVKENMCCVMFEISLFHLKSMMGVSIIWCQQYWVSVALVVGSIECQQYWVSPVIQTNSRGLMVENIQFISKWWLALYVG
jgi:hypothetical protein